MLRCRNPGGHLYPRSSSSQPGGKLISEDSLPPDLGVVLSEREAAQDSEGKRSRPPTGILQTPERCAA